MITISTDFCNPISQDSYENLINSLQFHQLTCTCGHSACLTIHGYYDRNIKVEDHSVLLHICRRDKGTGFNRRVKRSSDDIAYALNDSFTFYERNLLKRMLLILGTFEKEVEDLKNYIIEIAEQFKESLEFLSSIPGLDILSSLYVLGKRRNLRR